MQTVFVYAFILTEEEDRDCIWQLFMYIAAKKYIFLSGTLSLLLQLLKMLWVIPTRILHRPPCLWDQRKALGQRLHQAAERRISHHHHLRPVTLREKGLQDWAGGLREHKTLIHTTWQYSHKTECVKSYLAVEEMMVEHVVVTEFILTVELSISETKKQAHSELNIQK